MTYSVSGRPDWWLEEILKDPKGRPYELVVAAQIEWGNRLRRKETERKRRKAETRLRAFERRYGPCPPASVRGGKRRAPTNAEVRSRCWIAFDPKAPRQFFVEGWPKFRVEWDRFDVPIRNRQVGGFWVGEGDVIEVRAPQVETRWRKIMYVHPRMDVEWYEALLWVDRKNRTPHREPRIGGGF